MTTVVLVDDHEIVRTGLRVLLETADDIEVIAEAATAGGAIAETRAHPPDAVILDVRLPDASGITACREIRSENPDVAVLMLTSFADDQAVLDSILAGAAGFVLKQLRGTDLVDAIHRVADGETLFDPATTAEVVARLRAGTVGKDARLARLTPTEERIVEMIAHGLTNRAIGDHLHLAEKTIKNYVSTILDKLEVSRRAEAASYWTAHRTREDKQPTAA